MVRVAADVEGAVAAVRLVEDKMGDVLNCPVCKMEVFSGVGRGCKMCGMAIEGLEEFCCKICMRKFNTINRRVLNE